MPTALDDSLDDLWADPDSGWILIRRVHLSTKVTLIVTPSPTPMTELMALRKLPIPAATLHISDLKRAIPSDGRLDLGYRLREDARRLREQAERLGLKVESEDRSDVSFLPYNEKTSHCMLIDDGDRAHVITERMLAAGVKIVDATELRRS